MSGSSRWLCFNLVGAVGMGVQLATLALLNRIFPGHILLASAVALEVVLLHNFVGHLCTTWRDRLPGAKLLHWLVRFHLTNGSVSLLGNLLLMGLLVQRLGLPVLVSDFTAILACSLVNFWLSQTWAFAANDSPLASRDHVPPF